MNITEIKSKSLIRKQKKIDSWFLSRYGMNLYRGCTHNCIYCDGRAETYNVDGVFGNDISVKINAIELLKKELDPSRKRKPFETGLFIVGGGVCDSYEPVEKKYELTLKALNVLNEYSHPVHMLTKSTLIKRDIELLKEIDNQSRALISMSFSSVDDEISSIVEPNVPLPGKRIETLKLFKEKGFICGMFLMPVIPFLTDTEEQIEKSVNAAKDAGLNYIVFGGMTLKEGRQKDYFLNEIGKHYPYLIKKINSLYEPSKWGNANPEYYEHVNKLFFKITAKYQMPVRIPVNLISNILDANSLITIMLEHIDHYSKLMNKNSQYGLAANTISKLDKPLSAIKDNLRDLKGVGEFTEKIILEVLDKGKSTFYEKLIYHNFLG